MVHEKETVFVSKYGVRYRRCEVTECLWNAGSNELSNGGIMSGKVNIPKFKCRVCNCSPKNPIALSEALKVSCYPIKDKISSDMTNLEFIHHLKEEKEKR